MGAKSKTFVVLARNRDARCDFFIKPQQELFISMIIHFDYKGDGSSNY